MFSTNYIVRGVCVNSQVVTLTGNIAFTSASFLCTVV